VAETSNIPGKRKVRKEKKDLEKLQIEALMLRQQVDSVVVREQGSHADSDNPEPKVKEHFISGTDTSEAMQCGVTKLRSQSEMVKSRLQ
jgi:hypothetical protein